jgi:hypothetical protein
MIANLSGAPLATNLLYWTAGVVATVLGSWVSSKISVYHQNRGCHLSELKEKFLIPLRDCLLGNYAPLVAHLTPIVHASFAQVEVCASAQVTEAFDRSGERLDSADPRNLVEHMLDSVYRVDGEQNHYPQIVRRWERFRDAWSEYATSFQAWVLVVSQQILERSELPPYEPGPGGTTQQCIMHLRLAVYVYWRLFNLPTSALHQAPRGNLVALAGSPQDYALGSAPQIDNVLRILNGLLVSESATAETLRRNAEALQSEMNGLRDALSLAIASKRLHGFCDLVTFF